MTADEIEKYKETIHDGMRMVMDKAEQIGREESKWSISELGMMSDVVKDMANAMKDMIKVEVMMSEHSVKRY